MNIPKTYAQWLLKAYTGTRHSYGTAIKIWDETYIGVANKPGAPIHALWLNPLLTESYLPGHMDTYIIEPSGNIGRAMGIGLEPFDWSLAIAKKYYLTIPMDRPVGLQTKGKSVPWAIVQDNRMDPYDLMQAFSFAKQAYVSMPTKKSFLNAWYACIGFGSESMPYKAMAFVPHYGSQ